MKRSWLNRRGPIRRMSAKQQRRNAELNRARPVVYARSGGFCEAGMLGVCTGFAQHVHHVTLRSQGGTNDPANLLHLCFACHRWAHDHPGEASRLGLIGRRDAA